MKLNKLIKYSLITLVAIGLGIFIGYTTIRNDTVSSRNPIIAPTQTKNLNQKNIEIITRMHEMANTKIVAKEIWGERGISISSCDDLINEIQNTDIVDGERLIEILERWKEEDLSQAVEEHNYLWHRLNGNVGEATSLRN